jgi:hypothetical protein
MATPSDDRGESYGCKLKDLKKGFTETQDLLDVDKVYFDFDDNYTSISGKCLPLIQVRICQPDIEVKEVNTTV